MTDHLLARHLAAQARDLLAGLRRTGASGPGLGQEGDRRAHALLVALLRRHRPGDAVLSEENSEAVASSRAGRLWIVDPLDGTREYCDPTRDDWAVHVALADRGQLVAGAVALSTGDTHGTASPSPLPPSSPRARPRIVVSRSHRPPLVDALASVLDVDLVPMGSAGVKTVEVCTGRADAYVHDGGQWEWDSAAPVAIARAAGAHASRIDGGPLSYGDQNPYIEDLLICRPELTPVLLSALREAVGALKDGSPAPSVRSRPRRCR